MAVRELTDKQKRFVEEYMIDANGTQAAIRSGYSPKSAEKIARDLLRKSGVVAEIEKRREARSERLEITADRVLQEVAKIGYSNMYDFAHITPSGEPYIDLSKVSRDQMAALSELMIEDFTDGREIDENGDVVKRDVRRVKIKMHNKESALGKLMTHLGLLTQKVEVTLSDDFADTMQKARDRARAARQQREKNDADQG